MSFSDRHKTTRETEVTMIIWSARPQALLEQIGELESVGDYRFVPQGIKTIRDCYLDTADRALGARRLALRVREIDGRSWLALKGAPAVTAHHAIERLEIESPWPSAGARDILAELRLSGIGCPDITPVTAGKDALTSMTALGFIPIQEHTTRRDLRDVVPREARREHTLAELAIDFVVYRFENAEYRHRELEIESKDETNTTALGGISDALTTRYRPALRIWYHSKLATALALRALLEKGVISKRPGDMSPLAYDRIDAYLSAQHGT